MAAQQGNAGFSSTQSQMRRDSEEIFIIVSKGAASCRRVLFERNMCSSKSSTDKKKYSFVLGKEGPHKPCTPRLKHSPCSDRFLGKKL
jgi:hypothetical protein